MILDELRAREIAALRAEADRLERMLFEAWQSLALPIAYGPRASFGEFKQVLTRKAEDRNSRYD